MPRAGSIGLVTQSGSVGVAAINHTGTFAISAMISVGNEEGITVADAVRWLSTDGVTRAIAVFAEGFRNGRAFLKAAGQAAENGVPLVVCKTGRSAAAADAARSHSGNLATDQRVVRAVLEAHGVAVVEDLDELFAAAELLATGRRFTRRLGAVTLSGGHVGLLHDLAAATGVTFPAPQREAHVRIEKALGANRAVVNPLDGWVNDDVVSAVARGLDALSHSDAADGFILAIDAPDDPPTTFVDMGRGLAQSAVEFSRRDERPIAVVATVIASGDKVATDLLRVAGIPRLPGLRPALAAWSAVARAQARHFRPPSEVRSSVGIIPSVKTEPEAYRLLDSIGISVPRHEVCQDPEAARRAAARIGYPVVMKTVSSSIIHKTEHHAVRLGIANGLEAERAASQLLAITGAEAVLVAETVPKGIEAFVGVRVDETFGPVVVFGLGGIFAELFEDIVVLPAPTVPEEVAAALDDLKLSRLMDGYRGRPRVARGPLLNAIDRLGTLIAGIKDATVSIDVNPLCLLTDRAVALDCTITWKNSSP
jgi:acyl-CoA synthetase (NDP forming)